MYNISSKEIILFPVPVALMTFDELILFSKQNMSRQYYLTFYEKISDMHVPFGQQMYKHFI